jgi:galactose mutarotase-like enzyme
MNTKNIDSPELPSVTHSVFGRNMRAVTIANHLVSALVLVDQGADIHTLVFRPLGVDVLWKPSRTPREPGVGPPTTGDSLTAWIDYYRGGWNLIFPNFGSAVTHRGAALEFHGEAARMPWSLGAVEASAARASVELKVALLRSPFRIKRVISLEAGEPVLSVTDTVLNDGEEPMECMWAHHPAFGAPLVSAECAIEIDANLVESDDSYHVPGNDLPTGQTWPWPQVRNTRGEEVDLSKMPPQGSRHSRVLYLKDFRHPRFSLLNRTLGLGIKMSWDGRVFPYANFWQETGGVAGYPFFGKAYVMAIEPSSSFPAQGLVAVMNKTQTHVTFAPGEEKTAVVRAEFFRPSAIQ